MNKKTLSLINQSVISALESNQNPWRKTWKSVRDHGMPHNLKSRNNYSGSNVLLLGMQDAPCNAWVTYKQAIELGGNVRKGSKSSVVFFWQFLDRKDKETGQEKRIPMLKTYRVFNALRDCEGLEERVQMEKGEEAKPSNPELRIAEYLRRESIGLSHGVNQPCYIPSMDTIQMPHEHAFDTADHYQGVLAHEAIHSTGHKSRLDRLSERAAFGGDCYAFEELVAELGSCYLCGQLDIEPDFNLSASYLRSWLRAITENDGWLVKAGGKAQKAVDYILA